MSSNNVDISISFKEGLNSQSIESSADFYADFYTDAPEIQEHYFHESQKFLTLYPFSRFQRSARYLAKAVCLLNQECFGRERFDQILNFIACTTSELEGVLNELQDTQRPQFQWKLLYISQAACLLRQERLDKKVFEHMLQTLSRKVDGLEQLLNEVQNP